MAKLKLSSLDNQIFGTPVQAIPFQENDDFNEELDQQYGSFEMVNLAFRASQILYTMDPEGYRSGLLEYRQEQVNKFKDLVYAQFPTPIAYAFFRVEYGYENDVQRLHLLRDVWESLIYTLYALVVGESRHLHISVQNERLRTNQLWSDRLSDKLNIIFALQEWAVSHGQDLNCLGLIKPDVIERLRALNRIRNVFSHSSAISEEQARKLFTQYYDEVLSILRQSEDLSKATLLRFTGHGNRMYECRFEEFVGHAMTRKYKRLVLNSDQYTDCVNCLDSENVVFLYKDRIYSVSPFLHFVSRDQGHQTRLCLYKTSRGQDFLYEVVGEAGTQTFPKISFSMVVNDYQNLLVPNVSGNRSQ